MPLVQRRDLRLAESLGECDHAGVDYADREVGVLALQLEAAAKVRVSRVIGAIRAFEEILQERAPGLGGETLVAPVIELGEDEARHDEVLRGLDEQAGAPLVIRVGSVERREQRPRVQDESQESARRSRDRLGRDVCCRLSV